MSENTTSDDEILILREDNSSEERLTMDTDDEDGDNLPLPTNCQIKPKNQSQELSLNKMTPSDIPQRPSSSRQRVNSNQAMSSITYQPSPGNFSRYSTSFKHFKPFRTNKSKDVLGIDKAGFFSFITYGWLTPYMNQSFKQGLNNENIPKCSPNDCCLLQAERIEHIWKKEVHHKGLKKASLERVVWNFIRTRVFVHILIYLLALTSGFLGTVVFMRRLLEFCEDQNSIWWHGALWAIGMAFTELMRVLLFGMCWGIPYRTGIRLRSALMAMLYRKIMRLSTLRDKSIGELVNIFSNDGQRIFEVCVYGPMIVGGPFVAIFGAGYLLWILGPSGLFGVLVFFIFYVLQYCISGAAAHYRGKTVKVTDNRIRLINELLNCVKLIKMYAWEKPFHDSVNKIRRKEHILLEISAYIRSIVDSLVPVIPIVAIIVTLLAYTAVGNDLSATKAFTAWCIMDTISIPGYVIPTAVSSIMEMKISLRRIKSILCMDERGHGYPKPLDRTIALAISNATFSWHEINLPSVKKEPNDKNIKNEVVEEIQPIISHSGGACLVDIDVLIPKGRLIGICGSVAVGKSSFLNAILGQLKLQNGHVSIDGSIAYVSQQAWIMNCSLKDNILFGESFDGKRYYNAISVSALSPDISELPAGDETEIGERGINLSGGQRQRVAIARALYADKDIYLLDDPLSAVDGHVAQHIFENCILGALHSKTVIFVTHQLQFLSRCDEVIFMEGGRIVDAGPHLDLQERNHHYSTLIKTFIENQNNPHRDDANKENVETTDESLVDIGDSTVNFSTLPKEPSSPQKEAGPMSSSSKGLKKGQLVEEEKMELGAIPPSTYLIYIQYAGGLIVMTIAFLLCLISVGSTAVSTWWLAKWINAAAESGNGTTVSANQTEYSTSFYTSPDSDYYKSVYGSFIFIIVVTCFCRSFFFIKACLRASSNFHRNLFLKIFSSPMVLFDSTPVGRLLNIFSRDMDEIDCRLPPAMESLVGNFLLIALSFGLITMVFPWFLIALVILGFIFFMIARIFRYAIRDLKRIENTSRSPIYSHVAATVNGLSTIHAFGREQDFVFRFMSLYDENATSVLLFNCGLRWLAIRLDTMAAIVVGITAGFAVGFHGWIPAAFAGLALAYTGQIAGTLPYSVRLASEVESRFTSVQRMHTHLLTLESEGSTKVERVQVSRDWPQTGRISFSNVKMQYQSHLPLVLKDVSFDIGAQEKIGIVGRTGSGKSSLGVCLFRLVEVTSGVIKIDGIDISKVELEQLRSKISIIPQDPVLFIGTIRFNLDPFQKYTDDAIWCALEKTNMKERVRMLTDGLESMVVENGENFSVGERQLLCMARALLRHCKVLVLDEATAAIDTKTDAHLQTTLRDAFQDCTVLTIAHRLNTVLNCDRILVLRNGQVIEFDSPSALMVRESEFHKMMTVSETKNDFISE